MTDLPPVHRVVTGHDADGRAVLLSDAEYPMVPVPSGDAAFCVVWTSDSLPADNNDATDGRDRDIGLTIAGGSVVRIVDMLPGRTSPMHRTDSLDYGIVISGAVELEVDDGVTTRIGPGGVIVQRGTNHQWRNLSDTETCRIAFVLISAPSYLHDGQPLLPHM